MALTSKKLFNRIKHYLDSKQEREYNWSKQKKFSFDYLLSPDTNLVTQSISRLANDAINEITFNNKDFSLKEAKSLIAKDPTVRSCLETKALFAALQIGDYVHPNPKIQDEIRNDIKNIASSLPEITGKMASAMPLGFACIFAGFTKRKGRLHLQSLDILEHEYVSFMGSKGAVKFVKYNNNKPQRLPYNQILHVVNGYITNFDDPFGNPEMIAAIPYIKVKHSLMADMVLAGKLSATGILIGKTADKLVNEYDKNGKMVAKAQSSVKLLLKQLEKVQTSSVVVTDIENDISSLNLQTGLHNFYVPVIQLLDDYIRTSFHVPKTILQEGTHPNAQTATLAQKHHTTFSTTISAVVNQFKDEFINKICKPIILHNYSLEIHKGNFGEFIISAESDADSEQKNLSNIAQFIQVGVLDPYDIEVQNKVRKILGLPEKSFKEITGTKLNSQKMQLSLQSLLQESQVEAQQDPPLPQQEPPSKKQ